MLGFGLLGCGLLGCGLLGCVGVLFVDGLLLSGVVVVLLVDGVEVFELLVDFFFLAGALRSALSAGNVPPTSTPDTAAGAATLMLSALTPAPAVSVFDWPDLARPNAAANAATMATVSYTHLTLPTTPYV